MAYVELEFTAGGLLFADEAVRLRKPQLIIIFVDMFSCDTGLMMKPAACDKFIVQHQFGSQLVRQQLVV